MNPRLFVFTGGSTGDWVVERVNPVIGEGLPAVPRLAVRGASEAQQAGPTPSTGGAPSATGWVLQGVTSQTRYATRPEADRMTAVQAPIGRAEATCGALIPIRKSAAWWSLSQDERRELFEDRSQHISSSLKYLPAIARRLHHCRDLERAQPFDFLTWFDFAPEHAGAFEELVAMLRATPEWKFVDREVDVRVRWTGRPGPRGNGQPGE